jgi:2-polyprenyl-6-methoxyphenol hydroxylase-like FAD-dependent oxidoreductase
LRLQQLALGDQRSAIGDRLTAFEDNRRMPAVVIVGGGICGLGTALLLARDGHDVTVLERDSDPLPASALEAWERWGRKGVAQFRQPHNLMPGLRRVLEAELPDVQESLRKAGACRFDMLNPLPRSFTDRSPRPIDDQLWTFSARRPVAEWVFAQAAANEPRVDVRRGMKVEALLTGSSALPRTPHVAGVRTSNGDELRADLVVDASGRSSPACDWLDRAGGTRPHEDQEDSGFMYYTRYFAGTMPQRMAPTLSELGTISLLTLPGDNDTWSVTIFCVVGDQPLKNLRHADKWTSVVRSCPLHAHWLDGEPITDVLAMSGVVDRYRRFEVNGAPVATGFVAVADAWACTNPSAGRGLTVGFLHAVRLRDVLRETAGDPAECVRRFDARTDAEITPWYSAQMAVDRARFADIEALREGRPLPPVEGLAADVRRLASTMLIDPDLFRALLEYVGTITPVQEILRRPEVHARIEAARAALGAAPPIRLPGPDRAQLLSLVA